MQTIESQKLVVMLEVVLIQESLYEDGSFQYMNGTGAGRAHATRAELLYPDSRKPSARTPGGEHVIPFSSHVMQKSLVLSSGSCFAYFLPEILQVILYSAHDSLGNSTGSLPVHAHGRCSWRAQMNVMG